RRRHTRSTRDWSSDVCSSDLDAAGAVVANVGLPSAWFAQQDSLQSFWRRLEQRVAESPAISAVGLALAVPPDDPGDENNFDLLRSEERRVGKEVMHGWCADS